MSNQNNHGGSRKGAGRPVGSGKFKKPTKTMRIPLEMTDQILEYIESNGHSIPFFSSKVQAGYPAFTHEDPEPEAFNLYSFLVKNPDETYLLKATGESMINAGINSDDILVVDRKEAAAEGEIVIASINGEFTVKRLEYIDGKPFLMPENEDFKPIPVHEFDDVCIFGVVTHSIRPLR